MVSFELLMLTTTKSPKGAPASSREMSSLRSTRSGSKFATEIDHPASYGSRLPGASSEQDHACEQTLFSYWFVIKHHNQRD